MSPKSTDWVKVKTRRKNFLKVLLVEPKYGYKEALPWIPIGKGYLAAVIRREQGFEVKIIDNALHAYDEKTLIKLIEEFGPDIIGTGGMTLQINDTIKIAGLIRKLYRSDVLLVGGGVHLTIIPDDGIDLFDFIVLGRGRYILELCKRYKETGGDKDKRFYKRYSGLMF